MRVNTTPQETLSQPLHRGHLSAEPSAPANTPFQHLGQRPLLAGAPRGAVHGSWFPEQLRLPTCQSLGGATGCAPHAPNTHAHTCTRSRTCAHTHIAILRVLQLRAWPTQGQEKF